MRYFVRLVDYGAEVHAETFIHDTSTPMEDWREVPNFERHNYKRGIDSVNTGNPLFVPCDHPQYLELFHLFDNQVSLNARIQSGGN